MNSDVREKAVRAITEICNIHISLELKQKSLMKTFSYHTYQPALDRLHTCCQYKQRHWKYGGVLKVNYLGIVTNCLDKIGHFYAEFVHCVFCFNNLAFVRICSVL